jgi:hypothetical protein
MTVAAGGIFTIPYRHHFLRRRKLNMNAIWQSTPVSELQDRAETSEFDFREIPIDPIDTPTARLVGSVEGRYLLIRCVVNVDTYAQVNFGPAGALAVRYGDNAKFREIGSILGARNRSHLQVATYLEKSSTVLTFICDKSPGSFLVLQCTREFDAVLVANARDKITAYPILKANTETTFRAVSRISKKGNAFLTLNVDGKQVLRAENTGATFVQVPENPSGPPNVLSLGQRPFIELIASNSGADQRELGVSVHPKAI